MTWTITDEEASNVHHWMVNNAKRLRAAEEGASVAEDMIKHIIAVQKGFCEEKTEAARERKAYESPAYVKAVAEKGKWIGELAELRALYKAADIKLRIYQTMRADARATK
jgi:hypothetical protein